MTRPKLLITHPFDEAVALDALVASVDEHGRASARQFEGRPHPAYANMVGPFGGVTAAQALAAVLAHPERLGEPVALTVNFAAALADAPFRVEARPARTNRSTQHWTVTMTQTGADGWTTIKEYVARMQPDQNAIYYILGDSLKSAIRSPHLDYFRKHEIEVLYFTDFIDGYMVSQLREVEGKPLQNVDDANLDLPKGTPAEDASALQVSQDVFDQLLARVKRVLGERVRDVREGKTLVDSPARLVSSEDDFARELQYVRRAIEEDYVAPVKILEINRHHPIVANLSRLVSEDGDNALIEPAVEQLFDNLQLLDGAYQGSVADMVDRIQKLMGAALRD